MTAFATCGSSSMSSSSSSNPRLTSVLPSNGGATSSQRLAAKSSKNSHHHRSSNHKQQQQHSSKSTSARQRASGEPATGGDDDLVLTMNPFLNDFIDCIENLPNRLQLLLSELRSVDVLSNGKCQRSGQLAVSERRFRLIVSFVSSPPKDTVY